MTQHKTEAVEVEALRRQAVADAFKRMHQNVCYPQASDGEANWAADEILAALAAAPAPAEDDAIGCLLAEKPFWFDPATNFVHADDGGGRGTRWEPVPPAPVVTVADLTAKAEGLAKALERTVAELDRQNRVNDSYATASGKPMSEPRETWLICNSHVKDRTNDLRTTLAAYRADQPQERQDG